MIKVGRNLVRGGWGWLGLGDICQELLHHHLIIVSPSPEWGMQAILHFNERVPPEVFELDTPNPSKVDERFVLPVDHSDGHLIIMN